MKGKKAISAFMFISAFHVVIGALIVVFLLTTAWLFFGPEEKAEASTLKTLDDVIVKLDKIEDGQSVIAYGYVDKDAAVVGFSSEQLKAGDFNRPKQCGARSNSCICAFKGKEKVLECKGFPKSKISDIVMATLNGESFLLLEGKGEGRQFTLNMTLDGRTLNLEELA